jgi:CMP-N-acetylneuraminic acid synthetase
MNKQSSAAVIAAQGAQKESHGGSLVSLHGRLISYTVCAAKDSPLVQCVVVSTEDQVQKSRLRCLRYET